MITLSTELGASTTPGIQWIIVHQGSPAQYAAGCDSIGNNVTPATAATYGTPIRCGQ
ncbi:hypothetical protein GCM10012284_61110 [Mangrovihabitans endophyticus]|uniref:Uncharacterized protein n=1 Tax=Mangrovihabitans endophyticus TaxID=1751298 RepID=A0A8J3C8G5_9ACTN|nr:hypothetical protein GCM10012284_61110 [Mangrovihabitans endophyticus]